MILQNALGYPDASQAAEESFLIKAARLPS